MPWYFRSESRIAERCDAKVKINKVQFSGNICLFYKNYFPFRSVSTLELLLDKNDTELRLILNNNANVREEEARRLVRAMLNLKRCRESINLGEKEPADLYWDSWDRHHHVRSGASPRPNRSHGRQQTNNHRYAYPTNQVHSPPPEIYLPDHNSKLSTVSPEEIPRSCATSLLTPSPSPPPSPLINNNKQPKVVKGFPTTPPPYKRHQTYRAQLQSNLATSTTTTTGTCSSNQNVTNDVNVMTKSMSHELINQQQFEQIIGDTNTSTAIRHPQQQQQPTQSVPFSANSNGNQTTITASIRSTRLNTESISDSYPNDRDHYDNSINVPVPRSPIMGHMIAHRFIKKFKVGTCDLCHKQMIYGLRCKECKYLCHKDCETRVPPSCCLPPELMNEFKKTLPENIFMSGNNSPTLYRVPCIDRQTNVSSPASSCNSSTPSSPAPISMTLPIPHTPATGKHTQFDFSDAATTSSTVIRIQEVGSPRKEIFQQRPISPRQPIQTTVTEVTCPESEKTISLTSSNSASTSSDRTHLRIDSLEENEEREDDNVLQEHWTRQNSVSLKEWDIPFDDLEILEKIGDGRFGTVHRAQWHGAVAVKLLKENYLDNEAFILEVATFKKTRHENVVLFMGACIKPQAIVTSLCKGNTLYTHIHQRRDKFNLNKTTMVAQQISQGMGYLHARDIVHKDLKTKNIFLENGKVIITDFGLFSATKLQYDTKYGLEIPSGWLCYLAPELIQVLQPCRPAKDNMPFSKASDIYAFGTVWYELLCGEFPFKSQAAEAIIFQVGRGMKQTLANLQATRDVKDILMTCWAFEPDNRPDFAKLLTLLERLPKKRLARSPSHPVQLSRSAESVF